MQDDQFKQNTNTFDKTATYCMLTTVHIIQDDQFKTEHSIFFFCRTAIYFTLTMYIIQSDQFRAEHANNYCRNAIYLH